LSDIYDTMSDMSDTRISVRLDRSLRSKIRKRAKVAGKKEAEVIREALEKEFQARQASKSCYQLGVELGLIGCIDDAPDDLSANRRHMEGFGES
jgi:hypothetical protein